MSKNVKESKVLEELDGKSRQEQIEVIEKHVQNKDYKNRQFKTITNAFANDSGVLKIIIDSLRILKTTSKFIVDKHEKAFQKACSVAEKVIDNPNSTVKERADAIKLINKCYVMLTAENATIIIAILIPILLLISILTRGNNNNNVANTNPTPKK